MWRWCVLVAIASCGRIGFDEIPGGLGRCADPSKVHDTPTTAQPIELGVGADDVLCPGRPNIYSLTLAAGDELVATIAAGGPGWPTLELGSERGIRAVETLEPRANAFADQAGTYYVTVAGLPTAAGTPYHLDVALGVGHHVYVAFDGADANPGTFDEPWRDLDLAASKLVPGDVLIVKDGLFSGGNHSIAVDCSGSAMNGTAAQPIRIAALSERGAHLLADGTSDAAAIRNCAWWTVEGLYLENVDRTDPNTPGSLTVFKSDHVVARRILGTHNNRNTNSHIITIDASTNVLVEECEAYDFHRDGILVVNSTDVTVRRNVVASRGRADIPGGFTSDPPDRGDSGFATYSSARVVFENNIEEGNSAFSVDNGYGADQVDTRVLGNASLNDEYGFISSLLSGTSARNVGTHMADDVALGAKFMGFYIRSTEQLACDRCTAIGAQLAGWVADLLNDTPVPSSSSCTHCLALANVDHGFQVVQQVDGWSIDHSNAFGNGTDFAPDPAPELVAATHVDPQLGGCLVYAPTGSPMRGATPAEDIGAQIVYRYRDGALTGTPLWHPITGVFACGAIVAGVNDDPATSCSGVHQRLHVGTPDCALPYPPP